VTTKLLLINFIVINIIIIIKYSEQSVCVLFCLQQTSNCVTPLIWTSPLLLIIQINRTTEGEQLRWACIVKLKFNREQTTWFQKGRRGRALLFL